MTQTAPTGSTASLADRARGLVPQSADDLRRWTSLRGRSALFVAGVLPNAAARHFFQSLVQGSVLPIPAALRPARADLLVVVGDVPHKLAPHLINCVPALAAPAQVLAFAPSDRRPGYACAPVEELLDVDVLVRGLPPGDAALTRAVAALLESRGR